MNFPGFVGFSLDRLEEKGFSAYLVGGCVRDFLMKKTPHDFDITTNALPDEILQCFSDIKTLDIGKKHGTITLVFDKETVEVTTYRIDGEYKDSRHPESVTFTDRIEDDLSRRDFTMNAIAYSPKRGFVDPFCGRQDIENKRIISVGQADVRFEEDALRILRALRFSSRLGFEIEYGTSKALHQKKQLLKSIALERINDELCGILDGSFAADVLSEYFDVIKTVIPLLLGINKEAVRRAEHMSMTVKLCTLFSTFSGDGNLSVELKHLKFDSKTVKNVSTVVAVSEQYREKFSEREIKLAVSETGVNTAKLIYEYLFCKYGDERYSFAYDTLCRFVENNECMTIGGLDIKGDEIIKSCSIHPSKTGVILRHLLEDVINGLVPNQNNALVERAKSYCTVTEEI